MKRGYIRHTWEFGWCKEIEEKHTGRYGAPGQRRKRKKKASREEIAKQNQWKRERDVRRMIKWNFKERDYWMTVTYEKGVRPTAEEMKRDMQKLIRTVRRSYQRCGQQLKYVLRMGIGKRGGPHTHILVNRFSTEDTGTDIIFQEAWKKGHINFKLAYQFGGYKDLAEYITKPREEWEPETIKRYSVSRNLIRRDPEERTVERRSLIDKQGISIYPKAPKGYYIDPESVRTGINRITGYAYRHYTIIKLDRRI